jgi:hypothetical protein
MEKFIEWAILLLYGQMTIKNGTMKENYIDHLARDLLSNMQ